MFPIQSKTSEQHIPALRSRTGNRPCNTLPREGTQMAQTHPCIVTCKIPGSNQQPAFNGPLVRLGVSLLGVALAFRNGSQPIVRAAEAIAFLPTGQSFSHSA